MSSLHEGISRADFPGGGFVLHRVTGPYKGRCSGWYDANGKLTAAEQIIGGRERPVVPGGPIWQHLQTVGRRYAR